MDKSYPGFCLTTNMDQELKQEAIGEYDNEENRKIMIAAAEVEYENFCKITRAEEITEFAKKIGAKKIGIATCVGLLHEAGIFAEILRKHGFEVFGICCKAGTVEKNPSAFPNAVRRSERICAIRFCRQSS